jgi:hypothetical protein
MRSRTYFDSETVALLRTTLDRAWASLSLSEQARTNRSELAERILKAAATGERNPERLCASSIQGDPAVEARLSM